MCRLLWRCIWLIEQRQSPSEKAMSTMNEKKKAVQEANDLVTMMVLTIGARH
jgi:hypothetical protein